MDEGTDNRIIPVGVGDLAAAEHLGKAMDRIMFEAGPGLRAYLADPPGYSHGRDELDERGHTDYTWHPHRCGGNCYECHFASNVPADLDHHERDTGHHYFGPLAGAR